MDKVRIGVIGGSGVYDLPGLENAREVKIETPFGTPSDAYILGDVHGIPVAFLSRHARGHRIGPTRLNSRANIHGFRQLGVEYLISANACGSLQPFIHVSDIVVPDQLFDRTRGRALSFFDDEQAGTAGVVAHVSVADPFCSYLSEILVKAVEAARHPIHRGGTFVIIEGPRFSTKAESFAFKAMGFSIVGMTSIPEAFLAREAGMSYAVLAHVTDYDVWHEDEEPVTTDVIIKRLLANARIAKTCILNAILALKDAPPSPHADAIKPAIATSPDAIPPAARERLRLLL